MAVSDDIVKRRAWYERNFLEGYRRAGRHDAKWDAKTEEFVRLSADPFLGSLPNESADMQGRARTLVASGCDDPVVLFLAAGRLCSRPIASRGRPPTCSSARTPASSSRAIPGERPAWWRRRLRDDLKRRNEGMGRRQALDPVELRFFLESLGDGSYAPDDDLVLVAHLFLYRRGRVALRAEPGGDRRCRRADRVGRSLGAPLPLRLAPHADDAWDARGDDVCEQGEAGRLEGFRGEHGARAQGPRGELAGPARPARGREPHDQPWPWPTGQPGETPRLWFDRAVAARLDYMAGLLGPDQRRSARGGAEPRASSSLSPASARRRVASTPRCRSRPSRRSSGWRATNGTRRGATAE